MLRRRLLTLLPVLAVGAASVVLVPTGTATAAPPATTAGKTYVALGDSYAAGFGLPSTQGTPTGQPVAGCAQTTGDYPHLLAASLGLTLTDVTCSGATTANFAGTQTTPAGVAPAQLDVFKTVQPDLVTITIGGNDLGFSSISLTCLAATAHGPTFLNPTFASCKAYWESAGGAQYNPYNKIPAVLAKVDAAVKAVKKAAPNAKIAVIAYPAIAPDAANTPAAGCYTANATPVPVPLPPPAQISIGSTLPFTDTDVPFLQGLQQQLDAGIGTTAVANGAAYADVYPSSLSHSACQPEATRWVEPLIPADVAIGATNTLHPNLAGTTAMAATLAPVVEALFAPVSTPTPTPTTSSTTTSPTTTSASGPILAETGVRFPVGWLVGIAAVLLVGGAVSMRLARPRSDRGRHS